MALRETAGVSGDVKVTGAVSSTGQGSSAINLGGDVGGRFSVYSAITGTGYTTTTRSTDPTALGKIQSTPADVEQTGPVVTVGGNVGGGIYVGAVPSGTTTNSTADVDADGIPDGSEGNGSITSYGGAPALMIGATGRDVAVGPFGTGDNAYGLMVRGSVLGSGLYDGVASTALQIGGNGGTVHLSGGARVIGTVNASTYDAAATALHIGAGAVVPGVRVEGSIAAAISHSSLVTTASAATATALLIDSGGQVSTLSNTGKITAMAVGDATSASAVVDRGGGITSIENDNTISATLTAATAGNTSSGRAIALDLRANTTGVNLLQQAVSLTTVTTDSGGTTATTTTTTTTPAIVGDVLFGSGGANVQLLGGTITGAMDLGSGPASILIDHGASYIGQLAHAGPALTLEVENGTLDNRAATTLQTASLKVGASGTLVFAVDPANSRSTSYLVSGGASLAEGAKLGITLLSTPSSPQSFTLISSPSLSVGATNLSLLGQVPYLLVAGLRADPNDVFLDIRSRTAAEAGLNPSESAALAPVTAAAARDAGVQASLLGQYARSDFVRVYDQLLPDYAGGVFAAASQASRAISRAVSEPNQIAGDASAPGAWANEFQFGGTRSPTDTAAFRFGGFGVVGGLETGASRLGALGLDAAFFTANVDRLHAPGQASNYISELQAGAYWRAQSGGFRFDVRAGAGYDWLSSRREFLVTNADGTVAADRNSKSSWSGYSLSGRLGASYEADLGRLSLRPQVYVDYLRLSEGAHSEHGGGNAVDLAIASRAGQEGSATASLAAGWRFGTGLVWRPELEVGYRDTFSGAAGVTAARFLSGGDSFTLTPASLRGGGGLARLKLKAASDVYEFNLEAGGEARSHYAEGDLKFGVRVAF